MNKFLFGFFILGFGCSAYSSSWENVYENNDVRVFINNESMVSLAEPNVVKYKSIQIAKRDLNPMFLNNFKLVAEVVDNCIDHRQSIVSLKIVDAGNLLVENSSIIEKVLKPKAINLNSPVGKAHHYVCDMLDRYKKLTPEALEQQPTAAAEQPTAAAEQPTAAAELPKNLETSDKQKNLETGEETKTYVIKGEDWLFLSSNDKANIYIDPKNIKFNIKTKRVTFFSRIESKEVDNVVNPYGSYYVNQEVADCISDKGARLHSTLYLKNHVKKREQRFTGKDVQLKTIDYNDLTGKAVKYACDLKLASIA